IKTHYAILAAIKKPRSSPREIKLEDFVTDIPAIPIQYHNIRCCKMISSNVQDGLAHVCLITPSMTLIRSKIEVNIPRKRKGNIQQHEKGLAKFYENVMQSILGKDTAEARQLQHTYGGLINSAKAIRAYELFAAMTNFASIFHSGKINTDNWQAHQAVLEEIAEFLNSADLQTDSLSTETLRTIDAFKKLMGELLEAFPGITIQGYRLSTDVLERFFCRIAPSSRKRTRSSWHILKLIRRLVAAQTDLWDNGGHIDDYHVINNVDPSLEDPVEEFLPYSLDGKAFDNVARGTISNDEEEYVALLTAYCIEQYIRDQLHCDACLADLTKPAVDKNDFRDCVIEVWYLVHVFAKPEAYQAFYNACDTYKAVLMDRMTTKQIGERLQATMLKRVAFFSEAGSCKNGRSHRTNLLGFTIHLMLFGRNWVQEPVANVAAF
uniref:eRF1 domain-containing protein n=1 Tax=Glossina morsitans morsitans TaxID=37546 RepID=A0A1B0FDG4_GLOMM